MDTTDEPIDTINQWQDWYRKHRVVAEMNVPLATKDSREKLHDTSSTTTTLNGSGNLLTDYCKAMASKKAHEYFSDTIAEFANELSAEELYEALCKAAMDNLNTIEKEYNNAKQLLELIKNNA